MKICDIHFGNTLYSGPGRVSYGRHHDTGALALTVHNVNTGSRVALLSISHPFETDYNQAYLDTAFAPILSDLEIAGIIEPIGDPVTNPDGTLTVQLYQVAGIPEPEEPSDNQEDETPEGDLEEPLEE